MTGGAGYIGSVTVESLLQEGYRVTVLDDLSEGHRQAVPGKVPFYQGNIGDTDLLHTLFSEQHIDTVMHFAALALVRESVKEPERYRENNVTRTLRLLESMQAHHIRRFIFSSSCAIFGEARYVPIDEQHPKIPINPYGETKLAIEEHLERHAAELSYCMFRYFNAAGATELNGEDRKLETHIIPLLLKIAEGAVDTFDILGTDHDTPDGTCIRDYLHVRDIARAHVLGLQYLDMHTHGAFNLGNGNGFSVREVIAAAQKVTGRTIKTRERPRAAGDPARLVASAARAQSTLGWQPAYPELERIIESAWKWRQTHPNGYTM